ncbi:hypothetical protein ACFU53_30065 [Streptomyces sp. NPDC057474]|uniref:hypothetical protein n=1 Tax=Streptomyces sp. NPDC057474 TaxID=3346144 RepID=UPI003682E69C
MAVLPRRSAGMPMNTPLWTSSGLANARTSASNWGWLGSKMPILIPASRSAGMPVRSASSCRYIPDSSIMAPN